MSKYVKKPIVIDATPWWKNGDHPLDNSCPISPENPDLSEGELVRFYRPTAYPHGHVCHHCKLKFHDHGWIDTLEGGHIVCPGDWIITGVQGEHYPCKPDIFAATYELVKELI